MLIVGYALAFLAGMGCGMLLMLWAAWDAKAEAREQHRKP